MVVLRAVLVGLMVLLTSEALTRAQASPPPAEVADGDAPHRTGGCFAQAWTVAELLRSGVEDVFPTALEST